MKRGLSPNSGFTLIELLVALLVLVLMTPLLVSALQLGVRAWDGIETRTRVRQDLHLAGLFLARAIEQARPGAFEGGPEALRFVAPAPAGGAGLYAYDVDVKSWADVKVLEVTYAAFPAMEGSGTRKAVLAEDLDAVRFEYWFEYFGAGEAGTERERAAPGAWVARWPAGDPPALVRLRLRLADGARVHEVVMAPRVGAPRPEVE